VPDESGPRLASEAAKQRITAIEFPSEPRRILIIKPSAIGDVVHALPVLNLLRRRWPQAHISWLIAPACVGILEGHPQIDALIRFERGKLASFWHNPATLADVFGLARDLQQRRFDLVVDLQGLFRSGWLTWATRAPVRIGFADAREGAVLSYTHKVRVRRLERHAVDRYRMVAETLGCGSEPVRFVFATDDADRRYITNLAPARYAVLSPGTNWTTKRWPVEHFAALVKPLRERFGLETVIAGGPGDAALGKQIAAEAGIHVTDLTGRTNLRQLIALLERAELVVANDSGPMHIAAALNRPLVAPYGPTSPAATGPWGHYDSVIRLDLPCSPCYSRTCSHQSCLKWLGINAVLEAAESQIRKGLGE
jgi:lipopolysaccharide heptosyltransferase I